nr:MAG TPA: hypothetical protein [Caudoviricetes sp.]
MSFCFVHIIFHPLFSLFSRQPITADKLINVAVTGGVFYLVTAGTAGQHPANGNPPTLAGHQQQRTCHYG